MKYMGSKNRIAKHILPFLREHLNGDNYFVDAFCGGCNLIDKLDYPKRIANDSNEYLIAMWRTVTICQRIPFETHIDKLYYNEARGAYKKTLKSAMPTSEIGWVGFMASFNGRFFDGGYSGHKVKIKDGYRDYIGESIRGIEKQIKLLIDVTFICDTFENLCLPSNSVIYCDPPYKGTKQYNTSKNFDHDKFWQWCRDMTVKGHKVFVSEYNAPEDFKCIWEMEVTNSLNTKNTHKPIEKLFIYEK